MSAIFWRQCASRAARATSMTRSVSTKLTPSVVSQATSRFSGLVAAPKWSVANTAHYLGITVGPRYFSAKAPMDLEQIRERVFLVLKLFDKVDPNKVNEKAHFLNDLGLDSLDHVEVIMAIEDEFGFEIPEQDAERLMTPADVVQYVGDRNDVYD